MAKDNENYIAAGHSRNIDPDIEKLIALNRLRTHGVIHDFSFTPSSGTTEFCYGPDRDLRPGVAMTSLDGELNPDAAVCLFLNSEHCLLKAVVTAFNDPDRQINPQDIPVCRFSPQDTLASPDSPVTSAGQLTQFIKDSQPSSLHSEVVNISVHQWLDSKHRS